MQRKLLPTFWYLLVLAVLGKELGAYANDEEPSIPRGQVSNLTAVYDKIFTGYDKKERPYYNVKPEEIKVGIYIVSISHISEENMEFQADIYYRQVWQDPRLAFGDGNKSIILQGEDVNRIWLPDIFFANARKVKIDKDVTSIIVTGTGQLFYSSRVLVTLAITMDLRNYPMDEQTLFFALESFVHTTDMFKLDWLPTTFRTTEIATFVLVSSSLENKTQTYHLSGTYQYMILSINAKRRIGYFLMQFYFPCGLCTLISWLPFYMDRYSIGDRLALSITTLLTEMFLSQYINSAMPQVSYVKAADEYILVSFLLIFLALMENILVYWNRADVQKKRKKPRKKIPNTVQAIGFQNNEAAIPEADNVHHGMNSASHEQSPSRTTTRKEEDKSEFIDQACRVAFPAIYGLFIVIYFARGLTYYN